MDLTELAHSLTIPEQRSGEPPLELNLKTLQVWRDALPLANLQETTRRVYNLLRDTNRLAIPDKVRLPFIEALAPSIDYVCNGLSKACVGHAHPLPDKVTKLVRLNQEVLSEAAIAHKILVREWLSKRFMFGSKERVLGENVQAVLHYLSRSVTESYRTYVPFPDGVWGEIHALNRIAEARRLTDLKSERFSERGRLTVAGSYKRIVLLALASPYHLERGVIDKIDQRLIDWSGFCGFSPLAQHGSSELTSVVRLDDNAPPAFRVSKDGRPPDDGRRYVVLESAALNAAIDREINELQVAQEANKKVESTLSIAVLKILRVCWTGPTERGESRYQGKVEVQVAVGLTAVHYYMTHGHGRLTAIESDSPDESHGIEVSELSIEITADNPATDLSLLTTTEAKRDKIAELLLPAEAAASWTELRSESVPESFTCQTVDFSANGCQLICPRGYRVNFNVGDLISIGFDDTPNGRWKIGVLRWIRQRIDGDTQIGVRIIANEARGILAGVCDERGYPSDLCACVQIVDGRDEPTVLTPRMPFAKEKVVYFEDGERDHYIRLGENLETGSRFARFYYAPLRQFEEDKIRAEHNKPMSKIGEKQLQAAMEGKSSAQEILQDDSGVWDGMRHDW